VSGPDTASLPVDGADAMTGRAIGSISVEWKGALRNLAIVWAFILTLFWRDAGDMAAIWWNSSTFNHCLLILPILWWLVDQRKAELGKLQPQLWALPLLWIGAGALGWMLGNAGEVALARHLALVMMLQGSSFSFDWLALPDYRPVNWLIDVRSGWPMFWVIFVYTWGHLGFYMLILLAGLQAIPKDLYEAAEMDGTPKSRAFWRITLPLLMPTMIVVLVLSLIRAFQVFDEVYVLTGGGPGQATKMIIQHVYESAFIGDAKRYGIAAASSVLVAGILLILTLIQLTATRKKAGG
jgi:ABC-type sugar transport system permease subunit